MLGDPAAPPAVLGRFPFGQPATRRSPRRPDGPAVLFVLGVYPRALHIRWVPPPGRGDVVGALAVDDEPIVFWDGADAERRIATWRKAVGWRPEWGVAGAAGGNGSSGRSVVEQVLTPLGVEPDQVFFTDCLPTYFVKTGPGSQDERIRDVYNPFAAHTAATGALLAPADLPVRPTPRALVTRTLAQERAVLLGHLAESAAPTIVTLGQEAADVLAALTGHTRVVLDTGPDYGRRRPLDIADGQADWLALTHPGNRAATWTTRHRKWATDLRSDPIAAAP